MLNKKEQQVISEWQTEKDIKNILSSIKEHYDLTRMDEEGSGKFTQICEKTESTPEFQEAMQRLQEKWQCSNIEVICKLDKSLTDSGKKSLFTKKQG